MTLPPSESYVGVYLELPTGATMSLGLQQCSDREWTSVQHELRMWGQLAAGELDYERICKAFTAMVSEVYPDRYWYVEVWSATVDGVTSFYQIIQRPGPGYGHGFTGPGGV